MIKEKTIYEGTSEELFEFLNSKHSIRFTPPSTLVTAEDPFEKISSKHGIINQLNNIKLKDPLGIGKVFLLIYKFTEDGELDRNCMEVISEYVRVKESE